MVFSVAKDRPDLNVVNSDDEIAAQLVVLCEIRPSIAHLEGKAEKSRLVLQKILTAAYDIFVREGHAGFTLRKVAAEAGIAVGNLTYHYATKQALIEAMMYEAMADYAQAHLAIYEKWRDKPLEVLLKTVTFYVRSAKEHSAFLLQMWGYAGSCDNVKIQLQSLYKPIESFFYGLIGKANPQLNDAQIRRVNLQIYSLVEGYRLFIGISPITEPVASFVEQDIQMLTRKIVLEYTDT